MYAQIFLVISVRGSGLSPMTAASCGETFISFMKAAFGVRFAAGFFAAGLAAFAGAAFLAAGLDFDALLVAGFLVVAILGILRALYRGVKPLREGSPLGKCLR